MSCRGRGAPQDEDCRPAKQKQGETLECGIRSELQGGRAQVCDLDVRKNAHDPASLFLAARINPESLSSSSGVISVFRSRRWAATACSSEPLKKVSNTLANADLPAGPRCLVGE